MFTVAVHVIVELIYSSAVNSNLTHTSDSALKISVK